MYNPGCLFLPNFTQTLGWTYSSTDVMENVCLGCINWPSSLTVSGVGWCQGSCVGSNSLPMIGSFGPPLGSSQESPSTGSILGQGTYKFIPKQYQDTFLNTGILYEGCFITKIAVIKYEINFMSIKLFIFAFKRWRLSIVICISLVIKWPQHLHMWWYWILISRIPSMVFINIMLCVGFLVFVAFITLLVLFLGTLLAVKAWR